MRDILIGCAWWAGVTIVGTFGATAALCLMDWRRARRDDRRTVARLLASLPPLPASWRPEPPVYRSRRYLTSRRDA